FSLSGRDPQRVRTTVWVLGAAFAALSGVLVAPTVGLNAVLLTLIVVQAFGVAAIGRFRSLPATFLGGLLVGLVQALLRAPTVQDALPVVGDLAGLDQAVSFVILLAVLVFTRRGAFEEPVRPWR